MLRTTAALAATARACATKLLRLKHRTNSRHRQETAATIARIRNGGRGRLVEAPSPKPAIDNAVDPRIGTDKEIGLVWSSEAGRRVAAGCFQLLRHHRLGRGCSKLMRKYRMIFIENGNLWTNSIQIWTSHTTGWNV